MDFCELEDMLTYKLGRENFLEEVWRGLPDDEQRNAMEYVAQMYGIDLGEEEG